jgi:hypothetical protein
MLTAMRWRPTSSIGGWQRCAALLVANRHVHQIDEPAEAGRDELAERHQMALAVARELRGIVRRDADRAVEVGADRAAP